MKFATKMLAAALALGLTSSEAQALSCDEIMNMVNVNVPTNIVVQTMRDSGDQFGTTEVQCLESQGAPGADASGNGHDGTLYANAAWSSMDISDPWCGNGVVESGEQCDDGNMTDGDCCSSICQLQPAGQARAIL